LATVENTALNRRPPERLPLPKVRKLLYVIENAHPAWALPVDWADEQFQEPVARLIDEHIQAATSSPSECRC
jgi:hypothetical protein